MVSTLHWSLKLKVYKSEVVHFEVSKFARNFLCGLDKIYC